MAGKPDSVVAGEDDKHSIRVWIVRVLGEWVTGENGTLLLQVAVQKDVKLGIMSTELNIYTAHRVCIKQTMHKVNLHLEAHLVFTATQTAFICQTVYLF